MLSKHYFQKKQKHRYYWIANPYKQGHRYYIPLSMGVTHHLRRALSMVQTTIDAAGYQVFGPISILSG